MKNRLRVLRAEQDWSQAELADKLGVSRQGQRRRNGEIRPQPAACIQGFEAFWKTH